MLGTERDGKRRRETERDTGIHKTSKTGSAGVSRIRGRKHDSQRLTSAKAGAFEPLFSLRMVGKPKDDGISLRTQDGTGHALLVPMTSETVSSCWWEFGSYGSKAASGTISTKWSKAGVGWMDTLKSKDTTPPDSQQRLSYTVQVPTQPILR